MDIATIIGLFGGTFLVVSAILMGSGALVFINIPGILIVLGGTFATSFIKFSMGDIINSFKVAMKAFIVKLEEPDELLEKMTSLAKLAKREGLMALEREKSKDAFTAKALQYLVDGFDEERVVELLTKDIRMTIQRHTVGQNIFKGMGTSAPAFGMIGTLIGLVQMLSSMASPASIGPAMAVALLTTLYGALLANLVCLPLADKLALRSQQEQEIKQIVLDAAIEISRGTSGMVLEESLKVHLAPKIREKVVAKKDAARDAARAKNE